MGVPDFRWVYDVIGSIAVSKTARLSSSLSGPAIFVEDDGFSCVELVVDGYLFMRINRLGFDVVSGCQLKCVGCPNSTLDRKIVMISLDDYRRCLGNVDIQSMRYLTLFNFGEAFLHPELPSIVEISTQQKWNADIFSISTNAQITDRAVLRAIFETKALSRLVVSCDGDGTPESYEELRPPAKWDRLMEFLRVAKEERDAADSQVELSTRTICTSEEGKKRWNNLLSRIGWKPVFIDWYPLVDSKRFMDGTTGQTGLCMWVAGKNLFVDADGSVVPCCTYPRPFVLGNLKEMTYSKIVNGPAARQLRQSLKKRRPSMKICGRCHR